MTEVDKAAGGRDARIRRSRLLTLLVSAAVCLLYIEVLTSVAACGPDDAGGGSATDAPYDVPLVDAPGGGGGGGSGGTASGGASSGGGGTGGNICPFADPDDLSLEADGDGSLDIVCVTTGVTAQGQPWVRIKFKGSWLPPTSFYSWFAKVTLQGATGATGTYTRQRHNGIDDTLVTGAVQTASTTFTAEANGCLITFDASLLGQITSATITAGMLKLQSSKYLEDMVSANPFDKTVRAP